MGRPTKRQQINKKIGLGVSKMTQDNINKLKEVFAIDGTIAEACFYANISVQTYYEWTKKNPKLSEEFNALREKPVLKARQTVVRSLDNPDYAFKYLERKKKDEFSPRQELTGKDGNPIQTSYEIKLNEIRNEYGNEGSKCTKGTRKNI